MPTRLPARSTLRLTPPADGSARLSVMSSMDPLLPLKKAKHALLLGRRRASRTGIAIRDAVYSRYDTLTPYHFDVDRHRSRIGELPRMYFLHRDPPASSATGAEPSEAPRTLFLLWTGDNDVPANRLSGIESLRAANPGLDVTLVTPDALPGLVVHGHPLHPAYDHLSYVHRSDYLRAYLMHHHGGAYADIKPVDLHFENAIRRLNSDPDAWIIGYREISSSRVGGRDARLGPELRRRYRSLVGASAFACRPGTPFTGEWLREIERRLSYYEEDLALHPGDAFGTNPGYPIHWIEIGMDIMYPLELKHLDHVRYDDSLRPRWTGHR